MTAVPNRQPEGIPTGGQFAAKVKSDAVSALVVAAPAPKTLGNVLSDRYFAAKKQMEAHDQNEWVRDVHEDFPEAAYAKVNIENDAGGRYTAGVDLYTADGTPIDLDSNDEAILESDFDTDWDMSQHRIEEAGALCLQDDVFSLKSIQDNWAAVQSSTEPATDPFAHLTGMDKANAQVEYARKVNTEAAETYVKHLTSEILVAHPNAARINVSRKVDVEYGHHFKLLNVINADGDELDVDLGALQDEGFHDIYLDPHTDYDESDDQLYIDLIPAA
jgi:hypothetical protein